MFNPFKIAASIKRAGYPVISVTNWDYDADGDIQISELVNVQVGTDYLSVSRWNSEQTEMTHWPFRTTIKQVCRDIETALERA